MTSISVIMPVYNAAEHLNRVLDPLLAERAAGHVAEIIAVDDGSTDDSARICAESGLRVLSSGGRLGPAACRNIGVAAAQGDLILFVDSDVVCQPDVAERFQSVFERAPQVVAAFGSYDATPAAPGWVSIYRNTLHHFVHQAGDEEASTFWAGLGAVRRRPYEAVQGFDAELYSQPSIEDIELGYRLRAGGGRIRLVKDIQGTHLKRWTLWKMVHTDVFRRAIPWSRLLKTRKEASSDLNLSKRERAKALLACLFWTTLVVGFFWRPALLVSGVLLILGWVVNRGLFRLVRQRGGLANMLASVVLHQFYYLYCVIAWAWTQLEALLGRGPAPKQPGRPRSVPPAGNQ